MYIKQYVVKHFLFYFIIIFCCFYLVLLGNNIDDFLNIAAKGYIGLLDVVRMLFYASPGIIITILPFCVFIGLVVSFKRLHDSNEIFILLSSGVSWCSIFFTLLKPVTIISLSSFFLCFVLAPHGLHALEKFNNVRTMKSVDYFKSRVFYQLRDGFFVYVSSNKFNRRKSIFIAKFNKNENSLSYSPEFRSIHKGRVNYLVVHNAWRDVFGVRDNSLKRLNFDNATYSFDEKDFGKYSLDSMSTINLIRFHNMSDIVELRWRLYLMLSPLIAFFISIPFWPFSNKGSHIIKIGVSVFIFSIFNFVMISLKNSLISGSLNQWFGFELICGILVVFSSVSLYLRDRGWRY